VSAPGEAEFPTFGASAAEAASAPMVFPTPTRTRVPETAPASEASPVVLSQMQLDAMIATAVASALGSQAQVVTVIVTATPAPQPPPTATRIPTATATSTPTAVITETVSPEPTATAKFRITLVAENDEVVSINDAAEAAPTPLPDDAYGETGDVDSPTPTSTATNTPSPTATPEAHCDFADGAYSAIKGNITRYGEKVYHTPESRYFTATKIDEDAGERWFCKEAEALAAGWISYETYSKRTRSPEPQGASGGGGSSSGYSGECEFSGTSEPVIKGNIGSSGDRIYHTPESSYYSRTVIDESQGERWFCTTDEAEDAGWRAPR
jgi:hypothetical protein